MENFIPEKAQYCLDQLSKKDKELIQNHINFLKLMNVNCTVYDKRLKPPKNFIGEGERFFFYLSVGWCDCNDIFINKIGHLIVGKNHLYKTHNNLEGVLIESMNRFENDKCNCGDDFFLYS